MYGYNVVETLDLEIVNIQILDNYLKNGKIRLADSFLAEDTIKESNSIIDKSNKMRYIKDIDDEYNSRFDYCYTVDDILELLISDIDAYSLLYKVPPINLSNTEWELLFYSLAKYYHSEKLDNFFIEDMIELNKMTIAKAMVYEDKEILLNTYIWSLRYIISDIITEKDLEDIASQLSDTFGIDAINLVKNEIGEISYPNKNLEISLDDVSNESLRSYLIENGYKIEKNDFIRSNKQRQKIISISEYRNGKK